MASLVERDAKVLWHPASHFADHARLPPVPIAKAQGPWLTTTDGQLIFDAIGSWWTSLHGHSHPAILSAIADQAAQLDHVMLAGFTHEPAVALAESLIAAAPPGYGRVFYADCGSAAVEVALKLSFQSRQQQGESNRQRFATLSNSYHGETLGALAVSAPGQYRNRFAPLLMDVIQLPTPSYPEHRHHHLSQPLGADSPEADAAVAILREHASELTALVLEPLIQCAGKMAMYGTGYLGRIAREAQALGIHVIADEIAVAFGRTGRLFASTWADVQPDLMCLSKGLSGGVLPLSCVLIRAGFEDAFQGDPRRSFLHSHTFTGNPIACAAGLASLTLLNDSVLDRVSGTIDALDQAAQAVEHACPNVRARRQSGTIVAFDIEPDPSVQIPNNRISLAIREASLQRGLLLRPLHDTVYWMPPLVLDDQALEILTTQTIATLNEVLSATT